MCVAIENMLRITLGTSWNPLETTKIQHPHLPPKKKIVHPIVV